MHTQHVGLLYSLFSYFMHLIFWFNEQFHVIEKIQNLAIEGIKITLKADEKYHLHEFASEALYTLVSAFLKAIIACKEAPLHRNIPNEGLSTRSESWMWGLHK